MGNVLVLAEPGAHKKTLSAVGFAAQVASRRGCGYDILVVGSGVSGAADALKGFGAGKVLVADAPALEKPLANVHAVVVADAVKAGGYEVIAAPATSYGKDLMPRVAARLGAGMASDVVELGGAGPKVSYKRPMWAGNVVAEVEIATPVHVVTVRTTSFEAAAPTGGASPISAFAPVSPLPGTARFKAFNASVSSRPELTEARFVIAGGRGLKSKEQFDQTLNPLADALNAAIGATRAAVDAGFIPNDYQIGQTGKVVAPELYMGFGISGAIQHLAGMKSSKVIVAVNKDPEAPIFSVADYGIVADLFKVAPELTAAVMKLKG